MTWNSEDIRTMKAMIEIVRNHKRVRGDEVTNLYNSVFSANLKPTSCGSCINDRYKLLKKGYDTFVKENENKIETNNENIETTTKITVKKKSKKNEG